MKERRGIAQERLDGLLSGRIATEGVTSRLADKTKNGPFWQQDGGRSSFRDRRERNNRAQTGPPVYGAGRVLASAQ
jgi:hypothetical protein